jgi:hypothetical protein
MFTKARHLIISPVSRIQSPPLHLHRLYTYAPILLIFLYHDFACVSHPSYITCMSANNVPLDSITETILDRDHKLCFCALCNCFQLLSLLGSSTCILLRSLFYKTKRLFSSLKIRNEVSLL